MGASRAAGGSGRHLAVLRPAPVRGHLLATLRAVELRRRRAAWQLPPEAATAAAIHYGQHRAAPRSPHERADSQLQPPTRPRRESDLPPGAHPVAVGRFALSAAEAVG